MTGVVPFVYLSTCGCVFSQAGLKAVSSSTPPSEKGKEKVANGEEGAQSPSDGQLDVCPQCAGKYNRAEDVRMLNPGPEEEERVRGAMERRRAAVAASAKGKGRKRKAVGAAPDGAEGEQPAGKKKSGSRSGSATPLSMAAASRAVASSLAMEEAKRKAHMSDAVKSLYKPKDGKQRKETFMTMGTFTRVSTVSFVVGCEFTKVGIAVRMSRCYGLLYCYFACSFLIEESYFGPNRFDSLDLVTHTPHHWRSPRKLWISIVMFSTTRLLKHTHTSSSPKFTTHVAYRPRPPNLWYLHHSVNNHEVLSSSLLYSRVPSFRTRTRTRTPPRLATPTPTPPSSSLLILHHVRPRPPLRFSPSAPSAPTPFTHTHTHTHTYALPASRMFVSTERLSRLSSAWRHTPMKWNPLPWFVGALLLVLIQYRRHRLEKEVHVDEDGHEVIKLKGPWQVGKCPRFFLFHGQSRLVINLPLLAFIPLHVARF